MSNEQPDVLLRLRPRRGVDVNAATKALLKTLGRRVGLVCLSVTDIAPTTPIATGKDAPQ